MSTPFPPPSAESAGEPELRPELTLATQLEPSDVSAGPTAFTQFGGAPRLSMLGKRIEMLRVDRGLSKQALARSSGTSRQQLWRVMTGKAGLTGQLSQRLATVLDVDSQTLSTSTMREGDLEIPIAGMGTWPTVSGDLASYLESPALVTRSLRSLPAGDDGVALRTALLNAIEERARTRGLRVPDWLFRLRGSVLNGEL